MKPKRGKSYQPNENYKDIDNYIPTDSDDEYTEAEKKILEKTRKGSDSENHDSEEEVFGVLSSGDDSNMDSDLDKEEEGLPNVRAWGKTKRSFYSTDYVDEDFGGFQGKDAELADYEEKEARAIQLRLAQELDDQDLSYDLFLGDRTAPCPDQTAAPDKGQLIKADLSTLTKRQKTELFQKESPEFASLVEDFKVQMTELRDKLEPMIELIKQGKMPPCPAASLITTKYQLTLNYCTNISFYLVLKAKRQTVSEHPIVRRLVQYRHLLQQLAPLWEDEVAPQVDRLLEAQRNGEDIQMTSRSSDRKLLRVVQSGVSDEDMEAEEEGTTEAKKVRPKADPGSRLSQQVAEEVEEGTELVAPEAVEEEEELGKRGITRQIAKNKGLTPHRKKEHRNPRVKNRIKYRKAQIQRKGQVRNVRTEMQRYGGEVSGIKSNVTRGIKIKV